VDRLVTPLCVFRRQGGHFALEGLMPGVELQTVREQTGFGFETGDAAPLPPPSAQELAALDEIDPERVREVEFH
jgi:glutaconate CoA-transferase subunit B